MLPNLMSTLYGLREDAVFVAEAIAICRQRQSRHGIKEAGSQPPQTTITQSCI